MSALIRQSHANNDSPLWLSDNGQDATFNGTLTINGDIVTSGPLNSAGLIMKSQQHISILDANENEIGRLSAQTNGVYPANSSLILSCAPGGGMGFGGIGNTNNTTLIPGATPNTDLFSVSGKIISTDFGQTTGKNVGSSFIAVGETNVVVNTLNVSASSRIFLSHYGGASAGPGAGAAQGNLTINPSLIVPGTSFRVDLTDINGVSLAASNTNVTFYWFIIN